MSDAITRLANLNRARLLARLDELDRQRRVVIALLKAKVYKEATPKRREVARAH